MLLIITVKIGKLDGANLGQVGSWMCDSMTQNTLHSLHYAGNKISIAILLLNTCAKTLRRKANGFY
jgi:hypothetical protein